MKLTNQQIDAIIENVCSKNKAQREAEKEAIRNNKEVITEAKKYYALIQKIPKNIRQYAYIDKDLHTLIHGVIRAKKLKPTTKEIDRNQLRTNIILKSIDCSTLDDLKKKLNLKF